ncbi:hypothetical protein ACHAXA_005334 [Cyclostephanos tholiformis]|uniref:cysteine desulfurase n=1 Tax=Cyclostephanos tholiformis TaxID=382380 RepID=A0ABD3RA89_9STRA
MSLPLPLLSRSSSSSYRYCYPPPPPPSSSSSSSTVPPTSSLSDDDGNDDYPPPSSSSSSSSWWKDYKFNDPHLAHSVIGDFPILSTRFDADGKMTSSSSSSSSLVDDERDAGGGGGTGGGKADRRLIYLDSAATSHKPSVVTDALISYYETMNSNVHRGAHALSRESTEAYECARDKVASFVNARDRNEVIFTSGATEAINLVATSLSCREGGGREYRLIGEGDEILITEAEHHSNIVPWQMAASRTGATLRYVPASSVSDGFDVSALMGGLVNDRTKLVSIQHVSNVLGTINPIGDIVDYVRDNASPDVLILLDACQSVPHMKVDVRALGVDFVVASGHKMCGPTGIGFLWGREDVLNGMAPYKGGGEMIDEVYMDGSTYARSPARFEAGTPPIAQAIGLGAAIDYINGIGIDRIHEYEIELGDYLRRRLEDVEGVTVLGPRVGVERAALCSFVSDVVHPSDLGTFLDLEGVAIRSGHHCCQPLHRALGHSHSARASLYFYNTKEDVDDFVSALEGTLGFFRSLTSGTTVDGEDGNIVAETNDDDPFVPLF